MQMSIVVVDSNSVRRESIEGALKRAGWLLVANHELKSAAVAIIMDDKPLSEFSENTLQSLAKNLFVIGAVPPAMEGNCRETLPLHMQANENLEELNVEILTQVASVYYRHIFPITVNPEMISILATAKKAASSSVPVMIFGETGSGKEVIAKYIHHHSRHSHGAFVAMNCAAVPESMIEAALFGYEKGSFTNAITNHVGKFERANHGTLFLDELGEMSLDMQAKLLRVLQTNEFERIGGKEVIKVNVRVIAATNNNLASKIAEGTFRTDLYYRLNVINIHCLSLRERKEDIQPISDYFIQLYSQDLAKNVELTTSAINKLLMHSWPGNIRELQNVLHRAVIMNDTGFIEAKDIVIDHISPVEKTEIYEKSSLKAQEAETIVKVLKESNGCRAMAARLLQISPRTLRHKISRLKEVGFEVP